jgi:hypothetical protein
MFLFGNSAFNDCCTSPRTWERANLLDDVIMFLMVRKVQLSNMSKYEAWLLRSRNTFIVSIPVYLQLIERVHLRSTPLGQPCTWLKEGITVGNIFETPVVE